MLNREFALFVIPAKAGSQRLSIDSWMPAFAGMTGPTNVARMERTGIRGTSVQDMPTRQLTLFVIPAKAGIQRLYAASWMPACTGMTTPTDVARMERSGIRGSITTPDSGLAGLHPGYDRGPFVMSALTGVRRFDQAPPTARTTP
jgi:hypothetical protein